MTDRETSAWKELAIKETNRADRAEIEIERLRRALYKIAEDAEVAHQGGIHNDLGDRHHPGKVVGSMDAHVELHEPDRASASSGPTSTTGDKL